MYQKKDYLTRLLSDFSDNTISEEDFMVLMKLLKESETDAELYAVMDSIWTYMGTGSAFSDLQKNRVYHNIISSERYRNDKPGSVTFLGGFSRSIYFRIAASITIVLMAGWIIYYLFQLNTSSQQQAYLEKFVPKGQKLTIKFSDGSTVYLNSESRIRYPQNFEQGRELYLQGEGYFDVAHNPRKPFLVHTGKLVTRVLGTAFNISSYNTNKVVVTVTRGKVSVAEGNKSLAVLTPNESLVYNGAANRVQRANVNAVKVVSWKEGALILDNVTLGEAAASIGRWYDVSIKFQDQDIKNLRFTSSFLKGESIDQVMEVICAINKVNYRIDAGTITIAAAKAK